MDEWTTFGKVYKNIFGKKLVDYIAVLDILRDCVVGYSNTRISRRRKVEILYIESVLLQFLGFAGWSIDLDFSPIALFNNTTNMKYYIQEVTTYTGLYDPDFIELTYNICKKYSDIKKEVDEYYAS